MDDTQEGETDAVVPQIVSNNNPPEWPKKIIGTVIFLHAVYVFLSKFGVDFTFPKRID